MARSLFTFALILALVACTQGCKSTDHKLESELRARDNDISYLQDELYRSRTINKAMEMELRSQRGEVPSGIGYNPMVKIYPLKTVTLGRQTGAIDNDGQTGDEALQVVLEPKDADNHSVKVPGTLEVQVVEILPEGLKNPLSSWTVENDELSRSWRSGLLTTGYMLILPWKIWPQHEKLRVIVQFKVEDGRMFEAEKDFTVKLPAGLMKRNNTILETTPIPSGTVVPMPKDSGIPLPAPVKEKTNTPEPPVIPAPSKQPAPTPPATVPPVPSKLIPPPPSSTKVPTPAPPAVTTKEVLPEPKKEEKSILPPPPPLPTPGKETSTPPKAPVPGPNLTSMPSSSMPMQVEMVSSGAWRGVQRVPILPAVQLMKPTKNGIPQED